MENLPPADRDVLSADLSLVQETIAAGVCTKTAISKDAHWTLWSHYCHEIQIDPFLRDISDPIPFINVFAQRYRDGRLSPSGKSVTASWISTVLCSVGQTFKRMGARDPRKDRTGDIDYRISQQLRSWNKTDPPPRRVRPAPVTLVLYLLNAAFAGEEPPAAEAAIADMICIAFYFLLRPGEYTGTTSDDTAFSLNDIHLCLGTRRLDLEHSSTNDLKAATSVSLYFTTQKNQRKGDAIAHGRGGHPWCSPVLSTIRRILTHREFFASHQIPFTHSTIFASYYHRGHNLRIRAPDVTARLRHAASACFFTTGIPASVISARSLRAGGAMALFCGGVDPTGIKLLGRWESDSMMQYLHQDATPIMKRLSARMFNNGSYSFLSAVTVPSV